MMGVIRTVALRAAWKDPGVRGGGVVDCTFSGLVHRVCESTATLSVVSYGCLLNTCFPIESNAVRVEHFFWWFLRIFFDTNTSLQLVHCSF